MAHVLNDRIKETTTTTGTGNISLAGAETGFETFVSGIGDGNTTYYAISHQTTTEFEIGLGTVNDASPDTISGRTNANVISSSNSDNVVDFSAGTKDVFCTLPASRAITLDHQSVVNVVGSISIGDASNRVVLSKGSDHGIQFQTQASGQSAVTSNSGATKVYANISAMTATSPTTGDQAFVTANSGLYIYNGGGWYKVATVNTSPTISSPSTGANNTLATNGTATSIELVGADVDEGTTFQNSYAVTTGSLTNGGGATATITSSATSDGTYSALAASTNTTNRFFKITPTTNTSHGGTFSLTFSMSDNISAATTVQNFTLTFSTAGGIDFASADTTTLASHSGFDFGTNNFTLEFFYKWSTNNSYQTLLNHQYNLADGVTIQSNTSTYRWGFFGSNMGLQYESSDANVNTWYHYAFVRNGNTIKIYRDATETYSRSHSGSVGGTDTTIFGDATGGSYPDKGKLSNFRVIKGTALYTSAGFTIPSSNLTAVSGTSLLLFQENSGSTLSDGSSNNVTVTKGSNHTILTSDGPFV